MVKINYESDFSLKEVIKNDRFRVPFVFTYMVGKTSYVASWDGENTVNCKINEDGSVTVIFDKHGLEVGKLRVRREFFIPDENFPDGVCNMVSVDNTDIILVEGATEGTEVEDVFTPPYVSGGGGEIVAVEIVDNLESEAADKALSARQGKELKGMIPTKVSELENDEGYITEIPEDYATKKDVGDAVSGKQDALTLTVKDNGNIVIGNISGESKEFMPATPSGDPMHWAYVSAGAEWNDTDSPIVKTAPWGDSVQHLPKHYYLNGLGDVTKEQMRDIYNAGAINGIDNIGRFHQANIRTNLKPAIGISGEEGYGNYSFAAGFASSSIEVAYLSHNNNMIKTSSSFYSCFSDAPQLRYIYPTINVSNVSQTHLNSFYHCKSLIGVKLLGIKYNLHWKDSGSISKESVLYTIQNATPTSAITITLHADAYARLAEDADIIAALEAQPLVTLVSA